MQENRNPTLGRDRTIVLKRHRRNRKEEGRKERKIAVFVF